MNEQHPRLDMIRVLHPIDADGDLGHATPPLLSRTYSSGKSRTTVSSAPVPDAVSISYTHPAATSTCACKLPIAIHIETIPAPNNKPLHGFGICAVKTGSSAAARRFHLGTLPLRSRVIEPGRAVLREPASSWRWEAGGCGFRWRPR